MFIQCSSRWTESIWMGTLPYPGLYSTSMGSYPRHGRHLWPIGKKCSNLDGYLVFYIPCFKLQIGVSYNLSNVSIYVIDLKKVAPFGDSLQTSSGLGGGGVGIGGGGGGGTAFQHGVSFRKSFNKERPPGGLRQSQIKMNHDTIESDEKSSTETEDDGIAADIKDLNHYHNIFQPRGRECKSGMAFLVR
jgi:hypothetical protein